jgi:hypothetical protein
MKKLSILIFAGLFLAACSSDKKKQEKDLLSNILKVHDKLMGQDETLMKNKMQIDSLLKRPAKDTAEKTNMRAIELKLASAEQAMETWMQKFEPDLTGKSHDEIVKYYNEQKKAIMSVDSQMNIAITESTKYLSNKSK